MTIKRSKTFKKQYQKLQPKVQVQFKERLRLLISDPSAPQLRLHSVSGDYKGYLSINITGDVRALFRYQDDSIIFFGHIGTHSQLYG